MILNKWGELAAHKTYLTHYTQISRLGIQCHPSIYLNLCLTCFITFTFHFYMSYFSILIYIYICLHFLNHCGCCTFCGNLKKCILLYYMCIVVYCTCTTTRYCAKHMILHANLIVDYVLHICYACPYSQSIIFPHYK